MYRYVFLMTMMIAGFLNMSCAMVERAAPGTLSDANMVSIMNTADRSDIEGGHLAEMKASNAKAKAYGHQMVADHSAMLQETKQLSRRLKLTPVSPALGEQLMEEHDESMQTLRNKSGPDFDRGYIDHEITMHEQLIKLVDSASGSADNPALKQLLLQAKSKLQSHLEAARGIKRQLVAQQTP